MGRVATAGVGILWVVSLGCAQVVVETVEIVEPPANVTFTNATVNIRVEVDGDAKAVELFRDGTSLAVLQAPFEYAWDTTTEAEGSYEIEARALGLNTRPRTIVVDRTAPQILGVSPLDGTRTVAQDALIRVDFSEDVIALSGSVRVQRRDGTELEHTFSRDGRALLVVPSADLPIAERVRVDVAAPGGPEIRDLAGNALAPANWSFVIPAWQALAPTDSVATAPRRASLSYAADDTPAIAFVEDGSPTEVHVVQWTGSAWLALGGALNIDATRPATAPQLGRDGSDRLVVVFTEGAPGSEAVYACVWNGAAWDLLGGAPVATAGRQASLSFDPFGTAVVAYRTDGAGGPEVNVARLEANGWLALTAPLPLAAGSLSQSGPTVAFDAAGEVIATYADNATGTAIVRASRWTAGAWQTVGADLSGDVGVAPRVASDGGAPVAVWAQSTGAGRGDVFASRFNAGTGQWERLGDVLDLRVDRAASAPVIATHPTVGVIAAWTEGDGFSNKVRVARRDADFWQFLGIVPNENPDWNATNPSVAVSPAGEVGAAWTELDPADASKTRLVFRRYAGGPQAPDGLLGSVLYPEACQLPSGALPATLSATGCFTDDTPPRPAAGLIPFDLNSPLWSDAALKQRWIALPKDTTIGYAAVGALDYPVGTILVKEFAVEGVYGDAKTRFPMETRFLVKRGPTTWEGYSYKWRADGSDADLLADERSTETYDVINEAGAMRPHTHSFPSRIDCGTCHNETAGFVLGPIAIQLNRSAEFDVAIDHQLRAFERAGLLTVDVAPERLPRPTDESAPVEARVRSYYQSNCAHCHRGGGLVPSKQLEWENTLAETLICDAVVPGDPDGSTIYIKDTATPANPPSTGGQAMPPLAKLTVDPLLDSMLREWIGGLTTCP